MQIEDEIGVQIMETKIEGYAEASMKREMKIFYIFFGIYLSFSGISVMFWSLFVPMGTAVLLTAPGLLFKLLFLNWCHRRLQLDSDFND